MSHRSPRARFLASLPLGAALGLAVPSLVRPQTAEPIRIVTTPIDSGMEVYYANDLGLFAKAGLNVHIEPGKNGAAMAASVASNAADIGYSDIGALAKAYSKGIKFTLIAPAAMWSEQAPVNQLLVARDSTIHTGKDLSGKIVAVPGLGTGAEFAARTWIDRNGGDAAAVKFIELPYPAMPAALAAGRIDAAYVAEPFLGPAKKDARLLAYADDAISKEYLRTAWFTRAEWAAQHPDVVRTFAAVMRETATWANEPKNQSKSAEILVKHAQIDPSVVSSMIRARYAERLTVGIVQPQIDVTAKYESFTTFPATDLIYGGK